MNFKAIKVINPKKLLYIIIIFIITFLILIDMVFRSYDDNKNTIISQQEQQMLTIAKSACKDLEVFINEKANDLKILAGNRDVALGVANLDSVRLPHAFEAYYEAKKDSVQRLYQVNKSGEIAYMYPAMDVKEAEKVQESYHDDIQKILTEKKAFISPVKMDRPRHFIINIYEPVYLDGEFEGVLISSVDLNAVYERLLKPVKVGQKGYVMVKDQDLIIMHTVEEQVGIEVIDTRKELHPNFDFKDLENLINLQLSQEEGTMEYYSYWWTDKEPKRTKKLNAFSRAYIGDYYWIVAVTMDYAELEGPIAKNQRRTIEFFGLIVLIFSCAVFIIMKVLRNKKALEVETKYLRELNAATEELRKKDLQLQHSQKLQIIGTLTGGIAHEFNNLLTPIKGYTEIIMNKVDRKEEIYDYLNEIYEASGKAKNIIEQILVFSRLDNGKSKFCTLQITEQVEKTLKLVKSTITPNVEVIYLMQGDPGLIFANKVQIHQVVFNLCNNAFQAMKAAGGKLTVILDEAPLEEVRKHQNNISDTTQFIRITISDTGPGMNEDIMAKIFDPFFTTKPIHEGTGLGLFIVKGIVQNHKGWITVESEIGRGSTFKVYFPRLLSGQEPVESEDSRIPMDIKHVLLVDDQEKVLKVLKKGLETYGFKVHSEVNSVQALKIFEQNPEKFDVVVTDQAMPYIKGLELAERLKALNPNIKILLVTGVVEEGVVEYKDRLIIDDYLYKPVTGSDLAKSIRKILQPEG